MFGRLASLYEGLTEVVRDLDVRCMHATDAKALVETFAAMRRLCDAGITLGTRRVAETSVWSRDGDRSAAHWLSRIAASSVGEAVATVDTAKRLCDLAATEDAMRAGALSRVQVNEIALAASEAPATEAELIDVAGRSTVKELHAQCARVTATARDETAHYAEVKRNRCLRTWTDAVGSHLHLQSTADAVATVLAGMKPYERALFEAARKAGEREPAGAYAADALVAMARNSMVGGRTDGDGTTSRPPKAELRLRCDFPAFERGEVRSGETCEVPGIGSVPVALARSVAPDAIIDLIVTRGVDVRAVVSLGRHVPRALKIALEERYPTCAKWDCDVAAHLENDHIDPYDRVKETRYENIVRWCPHHHDLKTHRRYTPVQLPDAQWDLLPPDPSPHDRSPPELALAV